jgi:hypothetical protein
MQALREHAENGGIIGLLAVVLLVILKGANTQSAGDGLVLMDQAQAHP